MTPGGSGAVVSGTSYSVASGGSSVYIGGTVIPLPNHSTAIVVAGQTLAPGSLAVVVSGTSYSVDASGSSVYIDGSATAAPSVANTRKNGATVVTIGSDVVTASHVAGGSVVIVVGTQTISQGGSAITLDGQVVSAVSSGKFAINSLTSIAVPAASLGSKIPYSQVELTIGDQTVTALEEPASMGHGSIYVIGSETLTPGGSAKSINGQVLSAGSSGLALGLSVSEAVVSAGSFTFSAVDTTDAAGHTVAVLPDGHTLTEGGPGIVTNGETISLGSTGLVIHSGGSTRTVPFSNVAVETTLSPSAIGPHEKMLAISGTPMLFLETVIGQGASKITEYVYGSLVMTASVVGSGASKHTEYIGDPSQTSEAVITTDGHTFTAIQIPGSVVLEDFTSTTTVSDDSTVFFNSEKIVVLEDGSGMVVNGNTFSMSEAAAAFQTGEAVFTADGHTFTALEMPDSVVLEDGSSTTTLQDGSIATFDGKKVSVLQDGGAVVVNGKTISMSATTGPTVTAAAETSITAAAAPSSKTSTSGGSLLEAWPSLLLICFTAALFVI